MSKKGATSSHTLEAKPGALRHNRREVNLSNVNPHLSHLNESWESPIIMKKKDGGEGKSIDSLIKERADHYLNKHGRSAPGFGPNGKSVPPGHRTAFIRESCVVIKPDTTLEDVRRFADSVCSSFGVKCLGIWIHKDEGYHRSKYIEGDTQWKANLHAHVLFDWYLPHKGRVARSTSNWYSDMQDMAAAALKMDRGEKSKERKHIASMEFAQMQAERRIEILEQKFEEVQNEKAKETSKIQLSNLLQALTHHKLSEEIEAKKKELDALEAKKAKSEKAQLKQLQNLEYALQKAKENNDNKIKELERALQAKKKIYQDSMSKYDTQIQNIENQLHNQFDSKKKELEKELTDAKERLDLVNLQIDAKSKEFKELQPKIEQYEAQIDQYDAWISQFITEQEEVAAAWDESWGEFEHNTAGQPYSNRMEQLMAHHERLEAAIAPLLKSLLEKAPEITRKEIRSMPVKESANICAFLANMYPTIAPLIWGSAPGVIGSEPRRRRRGDDDDDEYNGISR